MYKYQHPSKTWASRKADMATAECVEKMIQLIVGWRSAGGLA
jgi:hypothetical protein